LNVVATRDCSTRLDLSPDGLLSTTRSVRRRRDLTRPVDPTLIEQCLDLAQQAPSGGNQQGWSFVIVTDPDKCVTGRTDGASTAVQASPWGSILPAIWSFMLAARARGLGTCWTTLHLPHQREAAELLGIPYEEVMQAEMIPVAPTIGEEFRPRPRKALDTIVHWDRW
jgi:nitroreductase